MRMPSKGLVRDTLGGPKYISKGTAPYSYLWVSSCLDNVSISGDLYFYWYYGHWFILMVRRKKNINMIKSLTKSNEYSFEL